MTEEEVNAILGSSPNTFLFAETGEEVQEFWSYRETGRLPPWVPHRISATVDFVDGKVKKTEIVYWDRTWKERLTGWWPWRS